MKAAQKKMKKLVDSNIKRIKGEIKKNRKEADTAAKILSYEIKKKIAEKTSMLFLI